MFDPTNMTPEQRDALLEYVQAASKDPIHMFSLKLMQCFLPLEEWVKTHCPKHLNDFNELWGAMQNQAQRQCQEFEHELKSVCSIPIDS